MRLGRSEDVDDVRAGFEQGGKRREAPRHGEALGQFAGAGLVEIGHADDLDVGQAAEPLDVELADAAGPDDGSFDFGGGHVSGPLECGGAPSRSLVSPLF